MTFKLGAHVSIAGGFEKALEELDSLGANCGQIFVHAPQQYQFKLPSQDEARKFKLRYRANDKGYFPVMCHSSYLVNIASPKEEIWQKSFNLLKQELEACDLLGIEYLNFHPGAHTGVGVAEGIKNICRAINKLAPMLREDLLLVFENTSGKGSTIGTTLEELKAIIDGCTTPHIAVCIDTCHAFSAGYAIHTKEGLDKFLADFERIIGLKKLVAIHFNDSMEEFADKKDRHENIGEGKIGYEALQRIINHPKIKHVPFIIETPGITRTYEEEMKLCREMRE